MIKGWRNDPAWVEFYAKRANQRVAREIQRIKAEIDLQQALSVADAAMRRMSHARIRPWITLDGER